MIFGMASSSVESTSILNEDAQTPFSPKSGTVAVKLIAQDETITDSVSSDTAERLKTRASDVTTSESVSNCVADTLGFLGIADGVITCGACMVPGNGLGFWDILECIFCISQGLVDACVIGYCQKQNGGSSGQQFCSVAGTVASTPAYLLPNGDTTKLLALAIVAGCVADEANDCISPLVP